MPGETKKRIVIRVTELQLEQLRMAADFSGVTVNKFVAQAVEANLKDSLRSIELVKAFDSE